MRPNCIHPICIIADRYGKGGRDRLSGVLRYAGNAEKWSLRIVVRGSPNARETLQSTLTDQKPHGIIVLSCDPTTAHVVRQYQAASPRWVPTMTVDLDNALKETFHSDLELNLDNTAIARESMRLLIRRGFTNFAYVGYSPENQISTERQNALRQIAEADDCPFYATDNADDIGHLANWLATLPKPCGIVTYYDIRSRDVLDACRLAHINVPQQMAIIGSDDDPGICEATQPTLTSVLPDFENGTYLAAAKFDQLLHRKSPLQKPIVLTYGVKSVSERESTTDTHCGGLLVSSACEFIRQHFDSHITVSDVAAHCKVSRRLLELRFRQILNQSVRDEIEHARLRLVTDLLRKTHLPIQEITHRAGFSSPSYLCALFQKRFKCRMRDYRINP